MSAAVLRILDANIDRAREALRVIEDYARFACDDADAAMQAKTARHALRDIAKQIGPDDLLAARDAAADVGRDAKTASELRRDSDEDVVRAAFARLQEAMRSIGEYGKLVCPPAAAAAEALRYAAYALEPCVLLRSDLRRRFAAARVYVLITEALCPHGWRETAQAALEGGAGCLQLREKGLEDAELLRRAHALRELTHRHGALLIVNDRADIARLAGADGVHVGQGDLPVREARSIAGWRLLVGKSTHTIEQLEAALAEQPDYLAVGPMFASATKPASEVAGPQLLAAAAGRTQLPVVAIGGITTDTAPQLRAAGASGVCVCAAVAGAADPLEATRRLVRAAE